MISFWTRYVTVRPRAETTPRRHSQRSFVRDGLDERLPELDGAQSERGERLVNGLLLLLLGRVCRPESNRHMVRTAQRTSVTYLASFVSYVQSKRKIVRLGDA